MSQCAENWLLDSKEFAKHLCAYTLKEPSSIIEREFLMRTSWGSSVLKSKVTVSKGKGDLR